MTDNFSIPISPKILNAVALAYKSIYRLLMEYLINSIDQATKVFFNQETNSYTKQIIISVTQSGKNPKDCKFIFEDNCEGFSHSTEEQLWKSFYIGNSEKSGDTKTVGKFGIGLMLFVGFFYELIVSVKTKGWDSLEEIFFDSNLLNTPGLSKVPISFKTSIYGGDIEDSFTKVILSGIKPNKYKEFNFKEFISEVELHLDEILRRGNLTIKLIDNKGNEHECKPFDYDSIECEPFVRTITELKYMHYKKGRKEKIIKLSPAFVDIYFKATKNKIIDRRPCFIDHGVRVDKVSKFEEFRANQKSYISHPNLVGYINITGVVEPSITRDAFEPNDNLKPLFYTLNKLEPEIKEYIDSILGTTNSQHTKALESKLNDALEKFLKKKNQMTAVKKDNGSLTDIEFEKIKVSLYDEGNQSLKKGKTSNPHKTKTKAGKTKDNSVIGNKISEVELNVPIDNNTMTKDQETDSLSKLSLKIDDTNEPDVNEDNKPYRSKYTGSEILIYQKHPSFQLKLSNVDGAPVISDGLITYLATEVVMHYHTIYSERNTMNETSTEKILSEMITSIYEFETYLKDLKGKSLTDLN